MRVEEKAEIMSLTDYDLNKAKDLIAKSAEELQENGLRGDAQKLMDMVYRIEILQHRYRGF